MRKTADCSRRCRRLSRSRERRGGGSEGRRKHNNTIDPRQRALDYGGPEQREDCGGVGRVGVLWCRPMPSASAPVRETERWKRDQGNEGVVRSLLSALSLSLSLSLSYCVQQRTWRRRYSCKSRGKRHAAAVQRPRSRSPRLTKEKKCVCNVPLLSLPFPSSRELRTLRAAAAPAPAGARPPCRALRPAP